MGSSPDPLITKRFEELKDAHQGDRSIHFELQHSEDLAHQIFAGCDAFLIPSLFEPCGLTQQISLKYATIPIARRTGGLTDTVFDIETSSKPLEERNGFTFDHASSEGVNWGIDRAIRAFFTKRSFWQQLMLRDGSLDLSWDIPADRYLSLYTP